MKKLIIVILLVIFTFVLSGCNDYDLSDFWKWYHDKVKKETVVKKVAE